MCELAHAKSPVTSRQLRLQISASFAYRASYWANTCTALPLVSNRQPVPPSPAGRPLAAPPRPSPEHVSFPLRSRSVMITLFLFPPTPGRFRSPNRKLRAVVRLSPPAWLRASYLVSEEPSRASGSRRTSSPTLTGRAFDARRE